MAEREFWTVSRMFVGLLERAEVEQLKERLAGLQAEVMRVSRGNRVMIELTIEARDADDASERVGQLLQQHLPSRGHLEPGVGCTVPLTFRSDLPLELEGLRNKVEILSDDYRLLFNPVWLEEQGFTPDDFRQDLRHRITKCRQLLNDLDNRLTSEP
jgi:hypothetical protein